jgi:adenylate kinase family enzyme
VNAPNGPRRIVVVGTSGSGKTTLAGRIAEQLGVPHVELDALHWEPNWTPAAAEVFEERVTAALTGEEWVIDGNYSHVRARIWARADTLVWLDYPLGRIMVQLLARTIRRAITREALWGNNRESLRKAFLSRDSILLWALQTYHRRRREYLPLIRQPRQTHLRVVHLRSPRATQHWLDGLSPATGTHPDVS